MNILRNHYPSRDFGLLILRIGIGVMFMTHGWPKITGGTEMWTGIGESMGNLGISFAPIFWGFMAAFAEFFGGLLLVLGLFFRITNFLLVFTMIVAAIAHLKGDDGFGGASHAIEAGILFFSLIFIGPGRFSLDEKLFPGEIHR